MDDRASTAAERGRAALARAAELRELLGRLKSGQPLTPDDVTLAEARVEESQALASAAHDRALRSHADAARAHRSAASAAERLGDSDTAARHREDAAADDRAAEGY